MTLIQRHSTFRRSQLPPLILHQLLNPRTTSTPNGAIPANNNRRQSAGNRDYPAQVTSTDGFPDPTSPVD
ncbi:hypothetical protein NG799_21725 [Laspinema sp. D1]|uniref:Uncharacterized protein n=1 Tax=Laspinema palackyanum D2a TaxID=2953684 RepID=A0ABT2MW21_9CYAN|nr:hypothetical protein [Laspinema sp. D2a]